MKRGTKKIKDTYGDTITIKRLSNCTCSLDCKSESIMDRERSVFTNAVLNAKQIREVIDALLIAADEMDEETKNRKGNK